MSGPTCPIRCRCARTCTSSCMPPASLRRSTTCGIRSRPSRARFRAPKNLLELARRNKDLEGFLFFSSSEIYGDPDPKAVPTPETYHGYVSSVGPRACYDESKRLGETITTIYQQRYNVPVTIVRPFNVFGPGMKHNDRRVIPMFTYQALNGRALPVHGDGKQTRTFCYVTDAIAGFLKILLKGKPRRGLQHRQRRQRNLHARPRRHVHQADPGSVAAIHSVSRHLSGRRAAAALPRPDQGRAASRLRVEGRSCRPDCRRFIAWAREQDSYRDPAAADTAASKGVRWRVDRWRCDLRRSAGAVRPGAMGTQYRADAARTPLCLGHGRCPRRDAAARPRRRGDRHSRAPRMPNWRSPISKLALPTFIEKPMATTRADAERICAAAARGGGRSSSGTFIFTIRRSSFAGCCCRRSARSGQLPAKA